VRGVRSQGAPQVKRSANLQSRAPKDQAGAFVRTKALFERRARLKILSDLADTWLARAEGNPDASCEAATAGAALKEAVSMIKR
jgi:hypothetical protein